MARLAISALGSASKMEMGMQNGSEQFAKLSEYILAYRQSLDQRPHRPLANYDEMLDRLREPVPEQGMDTDLMLDQLIEKCDDGLMSICGPRFFGWVMGASDMRGVMADLLVSAWGQNAGFHATPAMSALEEIVERWLLDLLDLPQEASIGFVTGATVANATCLAAARSSVLRAYGYDPDADGLFNAPEVIVFLGDEAHSSVFSALQLIGFGYNRVVKIATDAQGRMLPDDLAVKLAASSGPKIVIAQAGQINTGTFDPFEAIVPIAKAHGAWVHVDGAFGLWARASSRLRHLTSAIEHCDSWATDGHKWLQVPYDCGFAIVRDREAHARSMTNWASYLPTIAPGDRVPSALVPELSRRARGTPVWAIIKSLGRDGIVDLIESHCAFARRLADGIAKIPGARVLNDVVLNQVIVAFGNGDLQQRNAATKAVIEALQQDGTCFAGGALWRERWVMRLSVSSGETRERDIDLTIETIASVWSGVASRMAASA
jgi:glutamate/tyrosine decarboxylase-like PLP-dependent enzyme